MIIKIDLLLICNKTKWRPGEQLKKIKHARVAQMETTFQIIIK